VADLQLFKNPEFGEIRVLEKDSEPWFIAADVCRVLEHSNVTVALDRLDEDERAKFNLGHPMYETNCVNEPGLYSLVLGSRKPEAKAFKRWVTHEVIPAIRKTGGYNLPNDYPSALRALADIEEKRLALIAENAQQKQIIAEYSPKASYYDLVLQTPDAIAISKIAKDYGKSAMWLNQTLHEKGVQFRQGDVWLLYQKYASLGYTKSKTHTYADDQGGQHSSLHTYWTQKGRLFIYDLLKADGILPLIEQEKQEKCPA